MWCILWFNMCTFWSFEQQDNDNNNENSNNYSMKKNFITTRSKFILLMNKKVMVQIPHVECGQTFCKIVHAPQWATSQGYI